MRIIRLPKELMLSREVDMQDLFEMHSRDSEIAEERQTDYGLEKHVIEERRKQKAAQRKGTPKVNEKLYDVVLDVAYIGKKNLDWVINNQRYIYKE